jgi:hypothetical protein
VTAKDPIKFEVGTNFYGYALDDPVNKKDSSGLAAVAMAGDELAAVAIDSILVTSSVLTWGTLLAQVIDKLDDQCVKATRYHLEKAGIYGQEHVFKTEWGAVPNSRFDICACRDGSIKIKTVGQCGRFGGGIQTDRTWIL